MKYIAEIRNKLTAGEKQLKSARRDKLYVTITYSYGLRKANLIIFDEEKASIPLITVEKKAHIIVAMSVSYNKLSVIQGPTYAIFPSSTLL